MSFVAQLIGHKEVTARLRRLAKQAPKALNLALFGEAITIMRLARQKAPEDTGALKDSWYLAPADSWDSLSWHADAGFGIWYAYIVHKKHRTQSRFFTMAEIERRTGRTQRIERDLLARIHTGDMSVPRSEIPRVPRG